MNTKEYRASLAETFINVLQDKQLDWKKGWDGWGKNTPMNGKTKYKYKGINRFHLAITAMLRGYEDPRWCTYKQIQDEGWRLVEAKGQGVKVEYWFPYDTEEKRGLSWNEFRKLEEVLGERYILRSTYKTVFNATLIEGIPQLPEPEKHDISPDVLVDTLSKSMNVPIINDGGDRAFYRPSEDAIHLPLPEAFFSEYGYASTALHELAHATGAQHRLNRRMGGHGSEAYAFEELVAEISSCFMSVNLQAEQTEDHVKNHKAYVQSWIQAIQKTPETLVKAVQEAEKAASYMEYKAGIIKQEEYEIAAGSSEDVSLEKTDVLNPLPLEERKRLFVDLDGTLTVFTPQKGIEPLYEEGYFLNLPPHENVIEAVRYIVKNHPEIEVNVLSAVLTDSQYALAEKNAWLDKYLPEIDAKHRIFVPNGSDKKAFIVGFKEDDVLLDDYTPNLLKWLPAKGIKLLNEINHTKGTWLHDRIRYDREPVDLSNGIVAVVKGQEHFYDKSVREETDALNSLSLEERYTKAMALAGYEKILEPADSMATVAFRNVDTGDTVRVDGWEALGDVLEAMKPIFESDRVEFETYIHPQGRAAFYTKNLGGTGLGEDQEIKTYPDFENALAAYMEAEADGKELGYVWNGMEQKLASFDTVDMKHKYFKEIGFISLMQSNEEILRVHSKLESALSKDNICNEVQASFDTIFRKARTEIIRNKTEWGSWFGRSVNAARPQDYVDIEITGYSIWHEIHCSVVVAHANEIVESKHFDISINADDFETSVIDGMSETAKEFYDYFKTVAEKLDTDFQSAMVTYSPYTENTLEEHYDRLAQNGYESIPGYKNPCTETGKVTKVSERVQEESREEQIQSQERVRKPILSI